jgi:hypothetical protein
VSRSFAAKEAWGKAFRDSINLPTAPTISVKVSTLLLVLYFKSEEIWIFVSYTGICAKRTMWMSKKKTGSCGDCIPEALLDSVIKRVTS